MALLYPLGTIVLVSQVADQNGVNPKDRCVVLVRDVAEKDEQFAGVAITGTFSYPLAPTSIQLPYQRQGRCKTGLTKDSIAECSWIVVKEVKDILKRIGFTPPDERDAIRRESQAFLEALRPPDSTSSDTPTE